MVRRRRRAVLTLRCREIISRIKRHPNDMPNSTTSTRATIPDIGALPKGAKEPQARGASNAPGAQDSIGGRGTTSCLGAIAARSVQQLH
jgi:hypothetical protein